MKHFSKFLCILCGCLFFTGHCFADIKPQQPLGSAQTCFAVFIDSDSYQNCQAEVDAYRKAVEADGLPTWIMVCSNSRPEEIREKILSLASNKKMPLEGVVFVGNIPIPMLRDAQHLTSAFKMNQSADWKDSSIPSDRYYDDFDLSFNFIKQDEDRPLYYYYSLDKNSCQHLSSDIYSGRIKPLCGPNDNPYALLKAYLKKAAAAHLNIEKPDRMFVFCGHGYNSEAYDAWSGEQIALREQLPNMYTAGSRVSVCHFETRFPMKPYVMQFVQQDDIDIALLHHHGSEDQQYLNGYQNVSNASSSIENVKRYLRSKTVGYDNREERIAEYQKTFDVPLSWFANNDSIALADSLYDRELDIFMDDIRSARPNAKLVMLDACYNGSFHLDEYISGAYIFNPGNTLAVLANSVNSLQDKWPDRYIGLLSCGLRYGQWASHTNYLETHLIGDPSIHFSQVAGPENLNQNLCTKAKDNKYWLKLFETSTLADVQSIALRHLSENAYPQIIDLLDKTFRTSNYGVVRMECLQLLSTKNSPVFTALLSLSMNDSYELIRRLSSDYLGSIGSDELINILVPALLSDAISQRAGYHNADAISLMSPEPMKKAIASYYASHPEIPYAEKNLAMYNNRIDRGFNATAEDMDYLKNPENPVRKRLNEIKTYRNYHYHYRLPELMDFVRDVSAPEELRIAAVEALGWMRLSYRRSEIEALCRDLQADSNTPTGICDEAIKTLGRLKAW